MSFHRQPWHQRFKEMGDRAEGVFAAVKPLGSYERLGWRRPSVSMQRMSPLLRYLPDYYCASGHLVEVMGCGRDGVVKLKEGKYEALKWWNRTGNPVALFVWNSSVRRYALIEWRELVALVRKARSAGTATFPEGHVYFPIRWDWIEEGSLTVEVTDEEGGDVWVA